MKLQRYRSAAAEAAAFLPRKRVNRHTFTAGVLGGIDPRDDQRHKAGSRRLRGLGLEGNCLSTAVSEKSSTADGIMMDKPLKNGLYTQRNTQSTGLSALRLPETALAMASSIPNTDAETIT